MELSRYVERLRHDLAVAAEAGGEEARALADRLTAPLEAAAQLVLLDALTAAADEITVELAPGSVEVRLRGREPEFVVTSPLVRAEPERAGTYADRHADHDARALGAGGRAALADEGGTSRINLRLPDTLKSRVEDAARSENLSVNAWLVRAAAAAIDAGGRRTAGRSRNAGGGQRFTGWVQ